MQTSLKDKIMQIKLNSSNHITLHKIEEKMYTKEEVIELIYKAMLDSATNALGTRSYLPNFHKEWLKKNLE